MSYFRNLLVAVDQLLNAVLHGWADETLSSRCYRLRRDGNISWPANVIDTLFFWEKAHCKSSYESEQERRHLPPEFR